MPPPAKNFLTSEQVTQLQQALKESEIELVWYSCKEYIDHRLFQSVDELKFLLDKLLNKGELVIRWYRQIKNKGNSAYVAI